MLDFLGIGAQKAGTTWLMFNLNKHPEVWTPLIKELHYFDVKYLDTPARKWRKRMRQKVTSILSNGISDPKQTAYLEKLIQDDYSFTEDWYRHIFSWPPAELVKGEFTPYYSCLPREGIAEVKQLAPQAKLIYLIRDPVDRSYSSLRMLLKKGAKKTQHQIVSNPSFQLRGNYRQNITTWESIFDPRQILYLPFGRIKYHPETVMREVEDFLGLSRFEAYPSLSEPVHVSSKAAIDQRAAEVVVEFCNDQYEFLDNRFGSDFVKEIK